MLLHSITDYENSRYESLKVLEDLRRAAYIDTKGIPTIGIGFNLQVHLDEVLREIGFDVDGTALTGDARIAEDYYIQQIGNAVNSLFAPNDTPTLQNILNAWMATRAADSRYAGIANLDLRATFAFNSDTEVRTVFDQIIPQYETTLDNWLLYSHPVDLVAIADVNPALLSKNSNERLALLSLAYNNAGKLLLKDGKLALALRNDNRAEAWYEIRYGSNPSRTEHGIARRRYYESDHFSLYDAGVTASNISDKDAKSVFQTFTRHRDRIKQYESDYGDADIAAANTQYQVTFIKTLDQDLSIAKDYITTTYINNEGITVNIDGEILVGEDQVTS